jgi:hypothetical protein
MDERRFIPDERRFTLELPDYGQGAPSIDLQVGENGTLVVWIDNKIAYDIRDRQALAKLKAWATDQLQQAELRQDEFLRRHGPESRRHGPESSG